MNHAPTVGAAEDCTMTIVRGLVSHVLIKAGVTDFVQAMRRHPSLSGAASIVDALANGPLDTFYLYGDPGDDGNERYNIACVVGGDIVVGAFLGYDINNGDVIKFIASRIGKHVLFAHAMFRLADGKMWMPELVKRGRIALIKSTVWMVVWANAALFGLMLCMAAMDGLAKRGLNFSEFGLFLYLLIGGAPICGLFGVLHYHDRRRLSLYAERLFKVMGFKNPKVVDLTPFSTATWDGGETGSRHVFYLHKAIAAYCS